MNKKTILLVEDTRDDEELTLMALKKANLTQDITVLRDGAEALEYLLGEGAEQRPLPAVVFLDLKLPKIDGLDVLKSLKQDKRTQLLPVVILTSSDMEEDVKEAYRLGCSSFIQKPIDFHKFTEDIGLLGRYWTCLNILPTDITCDRP